MSFSMDPSVLQHLAGLWDLMTLQMLYGAIIFAVAWLAARAWANRSPALLYAFWGLVILRLLLPVDMSSPYSVSTLLDRAMSSAIPPSHVAMVSTPAREVGSAMPTDTALSSSTPLSSLCWLGVWILSALLFAARLRRQRRTYRVLARRSMPLDSPIATCLLERWRGLYGIRRRVLLVTDDSDIGPFTLGTWRPVVFVPSAIVRRPQLLEATLAHELAHIRRFDDLRLLFQDAVRVLWVGFPPVHWAVARMRRERERLCDELATAQGQLSRSRYVAALQIMLREGFSPVQAVPGLAFEPVSRSSQKRKKLMRFESLLSEPQRVSRSGGLAYVAVMLLLMPMAPMVLAAPQEPAAAPNPNHSIVEQPPTMINPMPGEKLTSTFGMRKNPFDGGKAHHGGVDIHAGPSSRVLAPADGIVELATERWQGHESWGTVVILDHGQGVKTRYAHLASLAVKAGDKVTQGQVIAAPGNTGKSTGRHLHFEVWQGDQRINPASVVSDWKAAD